MTRSRETAAAHKGLFRRSGARRRRLERREWWQLEARRFAAELAPECQLHEQRALVPAVHLDRVVVGQRSDQAGDPRTQLEGEMRGGAGRELTNVADVCVSGETVGPWVGTWAPPVRTDCWKRLFASCLSARP